MNVESLPKWMNVIPTLIGVCLSIAGMYILPIYGVRNTLGPIIGLPVGFVMGVGVLVLIARKRTESESGENPP